MSGRSPHTAIGPLEDQQTLEISDPLIRQRERTVDNVKRLYAVVFSLSFTNFVREIFDTAKYNLEHQTPAGGALLIQIAMLLIFFTTATVFFFQSDRFLDIRYTMPIPGSLSADKKSVRVIPWRSFWFAFDFLAVMATMIPFMLMSFTMDPAIIRAYGIVPFFMAYLFLLLFSGVLALPYSVRRVRDREHGAKIAGSETARYAALRLHWFLLNNVTIIALIPLFWFCNCGGGLLAMNLSTPMIVFAVLFLVLAVGRNVVDFQSVWPFLYLSALEVGPADRRWILRCILNDEMAVPDWKFEVAALGVFAASSLLTLVWLFLLAGATASG